MGDYNTPGQRTMEITLPKGHIIPPEGCIILPEGCRRPRLAVEEDALALYYDAKI